MDVEAEMDQWNESTVLPDEQAALSSDCLAALLPPDAEPGVYCPPTVDDLSICWPWARANHTLNISCAHLVTQHLGLETHQLADSTLVPRDAVAFRECGPDGLWTRGNWTNFTLCMNLLDELENSGFSQHLPSLPYIAFGGSLVSLVFLSISLYIFSHYRSLHCSRLSVHKNLIVALMLTNISMLVIAEPKVTNRTEHTYRHVDWVCKMLFFVQNYGRLSSIMWTWNEGFYLHSRITVSVFDSKAPFKFLHFMGWGLSLILTTAWAVVTEMLHPVKCWTGFAKTHWVFVIVAPMIAALTMNMLFLINILRILVTRLQNNHTLETERARKAIKAAAVLFPLLGITNLFFFVRPQKRGPYFDAYLIVNSLLQSLQGILVAIIYCFCNSEVRTALTNHYHRSRISRSVTDRRTSRWSRKDTSVMLMSMSERRCSRTQRLRNAIYRTSNATASVHGGNNCGGGGGGGGGGFSLISQHNRQDTLSETRM